MHIPDGYIGPQTYLPAYAAMVPLWAIASRKVQQTLRSRHIPRLALAAAFSFAIMMFNVPIPGGTTGHATGAVLIAVLLGPWAAMIAVSLALIVQALMFGDGGVTAIAANCFNMAVVMPFVGWWIYRLICGSCDMDSPRRRFGAAVAAYVGLNAAAVTTAVMFGIQPIIAHDAAGRALYNPFGLKIAVSTMALEHLLVFGFVEAIVTALVVAYLQRTDASMLEIVRPAKRHLMAKLGTGLLVLALLTPLGLYLPQRLDAGSAWGEWNTEQIAQMTGYIPHGMKKLGSVWNAPMPDYALPGQESAPLRSLGFAYIASALAGITVIAFAVIALRRLFAGKEPNESVALVDDLPK